MLLIANTRDIFCVRRHFFRCFLKKHSRFGSIIATFASFPGTWMLFDYDLEAQGSPLLGGLPPGSRKALLRLPKPTARHDAEKKRLDHDLEGCFFHGTKTQFHRDLVCSSVKVCHEGSGKKLHRKVPRKGSAYMCQIKVPHQS